MVAKTAEQGNASCGTKVGTEDIQGSAGDGGREEVKMVHGKFSGTRRCRSFAVSKGSCASHPY